LRTSCNKQQYHIPKCKIARDQLNEALGYDIVAYYKKFARATSTDFEMPPSKKINTIKKIRDKVHAEGMEFYSADNDFRHLGDGVSCCGVNCQDCFSGYEHRFTANTGRALEIAKEKGEVHFKDVFSEEAMSDIDKAFMTGDPKEYINQGSSENILRQRGKTWFDYALKNWDNPRSPNNPARFYVCLKPNGLDEEGHVIYKYYDV